MPDYSKGKIYAIRSFKTDNVYIGSTTQTLAQRLGKHRTNYKNWKNNTYRYVSSFKILEHNDEYIELVEEYPCENVYQLRKKEGEYIRSMNCVNIRNTGLTEEQIKERNKKQQKEWRNNNKTIISNKNKEQRKNNIEFYRKRDIEYSKKYKEKNPEKSKQYKSEWYNRNKEKLSKKHICECGGKYTRDHKETHYKTIKHQNYIQSIE